MTPILKDLLFERSCRDVQNASARELSKRGMTRSNIERHGFAYKIFVALPEEHEIMLLAHPGVAHTKVTTFLHPVPDTAHLGKRVGRAMGKAGLRDEAHDGGRAALFKSENLRGVARKSKEFLLEFLMLGTGEGLDKQSELAQTSVLQNPAFIEAVEADIQFGGRGQALMLRIFGDVTIAMTRSRLNKQWRMQALRRYKDFFYMSMPESFFKRGKAPYRMYGMTTRILIDMAQLVDNVLTLLVLYPNAEICLSKISSYACEKLWSQLVRMAGYKPNSNLLEALLRKSVQRLELLLDEELKFCTERARADRQYYASGAAGSRKVTSDDGSRLGPAGNIVAELWDPTVKEAKRRRAQEPKGATPRGFALPKAGGEIAPAAAAQAPAAAPAAAQAPAAAAAPQAAAPAPRAPAAPAAAAPAGAAEGVQGGRAAREGRGQRRPRGGSDAVGKGKSVNKNNE